MFRANDEQVSINDKLTREKFQTRVFHCLLNEISFVIIFPYNHDYRPHKILIPIFHLSYEFAIASTFPFFFRYKFLRVDPQQFWSFFTR